MRELWINKETDNYTERRIEKKERKSVIRMKKLMKTTIIL